MPDQAERMRQIAELYRRPSRPHVITVTSGKGGAGKSTVALNLAITFCDMGKRVILLDADANLGGLDVMLKLSPRYRLADVLRDDVDLEDALMSPREGLRVLAGNSGEVDYPLLTPGVQERLIDEIIGLRERYDVLMIDTAAGLTPEIIQFAEPADETLVVTTTEPTSILDAYAMMKVLWASRPDAAVNLVVNAVRQPADADETVNRLRLAVDHFLGRSFGYPGFVPFDTCVHKAIVRQEPVITMFPRSAASLSIRAIGRSMAGEFMNYSPLKAVTV
jgi:flagellar biosynthesis protein FlhG